MIFNKSLAKKNLGQICLDFYRLMQFDTKMMFLILIM